jgi:hypothetical protein
LRVSLVSRLALVCIGFNLVTLGVMAVPLLGAAATSLSATSLSATSLSIPASLLPASPPRRCHGSPVHTLPFTPVCSHPPVHTLPCTPSRSHPPSTPSVPTLPFTPFPFTGVAATSFSAAAMLELCTCSKGATPDEVDVAQLRACAADQSAALGVLSVLVRLILTRSLTLTRTRTRTRTLP